MADDFDTIDLNEIPDDLVASEEVRASGVDIRTLPEGKYVVEVDEMKLRRVPADNEYNPNRLTANFKMKTEEGRILFMDVSWEPSQSSDDGTDSATKLYSQVEQALNMYGEPVKEVLQAAETASFEVEIIESARVTVGDLPEDKQEYYTDVKGLGEMSPVTFYIKADDNDSRMHLYSQGAKVRNYIRRVSAN